jgi:hypothetical protein
MEGEAKAAKDARPAIPCGAYSGIQVTENKSEMVLGQSL